MDPEQQLSPREEAAPSRCRKCRQWVCGNRLLFAGIALTAIYITGIAVYFCAKWTAIWALAPNEAGDMLAGMFGPLAFAWLVLGYFQQGQELRQNNEALRLQAQELHHSVEQQKRLVEENRKQLELQKNEFEYAVENDKKYKEEQRKERQPLFKVAPMVPVGSSLRRGNDEKRWRCSLPLWIGRNPCHSLDLFIINTAKKREKVQSYFNVLNPGEKKPLGLHFNYPECIQDIDGCLLEVQYKDMFGEKNTVVFSIQFKARLVPQNQSTDSGVVGYLNFILPD